MDLLDTRLLYYVFLRIYSEQCLRIYSEQCLRIYSEQGLRIYSEQGLRIYSEENNTYKLVYVLFYYVLVLTSSTSFDGMYCLLYFSVCVYFSFFMNIELFFTSVFRLFPI